MQTISVTVGALAAASATAVSASQLPPGAHALGLNGGGASGNSATNIAAAQSAGGAGNLTINGALASGGIATLPTGGASVLITSAANDSGITFTVTGTAYGPNGGPFSVVETVTGSNASVVATRNVFKTVTQIAVSGATAGNVSVGTNGTVTFAKPRRVLFTTTADETAKTLTVYGTDWNGNPVSEVVVGPNNTTGYTTIDFATVTAIWPSAAISAAMTVGTNGVASSRPVSLDEYANAGVGLQVDVSGTVNYTVQSTFDNPNLIGWANVLWVDSSDTGVVGATATKQSSFAYSPRFTRVTLNSGTGSLRFTVLQTGSISGVT